MRDNNTTIAAHQNGFVVTNNSERKGQQVETITNYNLSGAQSTVNTYDGGRSRSVEMTQVLTENVTTADGIQAPRGSTMSTFWAADGSAHTRVEQPNGQIHNYMAGGANAPRAWTYSQYATPTNLEFNINGQNQAFPGITSADRDKMNGSVHLNSDVGTWTLTPAQNGAIANVQFTPNKPIPGK